MIGLEILKAVKENNCVAFPVQNIDRFPCVALLRKDGKMTRITSEFLSISQSRISKNWENWWEPILLTTIASTTAGMTARTVSLKTRWWSRDRSGQWSYRSCSWFTNFRLRWWDWKLTNMCLNLTCSEMWSLCQWPNMWLCPHAKCCKGGCV